MSYRQPSFMVDHPLSRVDDYTVDVYAAPNTTGLDDSDRRAVIDFRLGSKATYTATGGNAGMRFKLPDATPAADYDCFLIGGGHNLQSGDALRLYSADNVGFSPTDLLVGYTYGGGKNPIESVIAAGSLQWWAFQVSTSTSQNFEIPQFWIGNKKTLSADAHLAPSFGAGWRNQVTRTEYPGGIASQELSPARRTFALNVMNITAGSTDDDILLEVAQNGRARPFWYWPPDDDDPGPFLVLLDDDAERVQEYPAPTVSIRYRYSMRMTEQTF